MTLRVNFNQRGCYVLEIDQIRDDKHIVSYTCFVIMIVDFHHVRFIMLKLKNSIKQKQRLGL